MSHLTRLFFCPFFLCLHCPFSLPFLSLLSHFCFFRFMSILFFVPNFCPFSCLYFLLFESRFSILPPFIAHFSCYRDQRDNDTPSFTLLYAAISRQKYITRLCIYYIMWAAFEMFGQKNDYMN